MVENTGATRTAQPCYGTYPVAAVASDGTQFIPAIFYIVASKNIGIVRKEPDGQCVYFANTLYANPQIAAKHAKKMCQEWEVYLRECS